jgi:hypothetical protein
MWPRMDHRSLNMIFLKNSILLEVHIVQIVITFLLQRNEKIKRKMLSRIGM